MKCPKCGSETHLQYGKRICNNKNCKQQRLDNVLSKFEKGKDWHWFTINYNVEIYYDIDCGFCLRTSVDNISEYQDISLNTVESLIKDLEEGN